MYSERGQERDIMNGGGVNLVAELLHSPLVLADALDGFSPSLLLSIQLALHLPNLQPPQTGP